VAEKPDAEYDKAEFVIDTSGLLDGAQRWYPMENFPGLWEKLDGLIADGSMISVSEVYKELERQEGDPIHLWCKARKKMFKPLTLKVQEATGTVLAAHRNLVHERRERSRADPFVIGLAIASETIVITGERPSASIAKPRIPDVCKAMGVGCISLPDLIRRRGWKF
jgi:Domain of unknown function (DUF4411)